MIFDKIKDFGKKSSLACWGGTSFPWILDLLYYNMEELITYVDRRLTTDEVAEFYQKREKLIDEIKEIRPHDIWEDELTLKRWICKNYDFEKNPKAQELMNKYNQLESEWVSMYSSQMKLLLCEIIDLVDWYIYNDWSGDYMTKEDAKQYVLTSK